MIKKEMIAMLLAGGQGSRLGILTQKIAKPAVSFGGKYRIIDFPLSNCINSGIDTVGILTQYQPLDLNTYVGNGQPWDLDTLDGGVYILPPYMSAEKGEWYKGTANAIYQNIGFIERFDPKYVLILSGDHIYKMNYTKMLRAHIANNADATIATIAVPLNEASRFGILLSDENNKIGSVNTLFSKVRMRDYSFFDFFKFKIHLINFFVLSFLWAVYNFIKYGIQSTLNEIPEYYNNTYWRLIIHILELITLFLIMLLYIINQKSFNKILISIELIVFILLIISEYLDDEKVNISSYIISLLIARVVWNCLYLLLIIIALFIYPIMLRSKGLGWNIALGIFGKLVVTFIIDLADKHVYILYFLLLNFLMLVFSNRLPPRIGSLLIDFGKDDKERKFSDKNLKDDKEDDDNNNIKEKNEMKII